MHGFLYACITSSLYLIFMKCCLSDILCKNQPLVESWWENHKLPFRVFLFKLYLKCMNDIHFCIFMSVIRVINYMKFNAISLSKGHNTFTPINLFNFELAFLDLLIPLTIWPQWTI